MDNRRSPLSIAIATTANRSARIRALAEKHPYMTPLDIARLTGEAPQLVRHALERDDHDARPPAPTRRIGAKAPPSAPQLMVR